MSSRILLVLIISVILCSDGYAAYMPPGGSNGSIQYNKSGSFGGGSNATLDSVGNIIATSIATGGVSPTKTGSVLFNGVTSGTVAFGAADIAGTAITYILPSTNGVSGQFLEDAGSTTCPTYASGTPATCHQLTWITLAAHSIGIAIDGGGSAITTGFKGNWTSPYACTIISATLTSDISGSIVIDVWKNNAAIPTVANTITASALPTLSSATYHQDTTLTGWTKSVAKNDVLGFNVNSASTVTHATLVLGCQ